MTQERKACHLCKQYIDQQGVLENCKHEFCFQCILQWSEESDHCPVCDSPFGLIYKITKKKKSLNDDSDSSSQRQTPSYTPPKRRRSVILSDDENPQSQGTPVKGYTSEDDQKSEKTTEPKSLFGELSPLRRSLPEVTKKRRKLTNSTQEVRSSSFLKQKNTQGETLSQSAARGFARLSQVPSSQQSNHTPDALRSSFYNHLQSKKFDNSYGMKPKDSQEVAMSKFIRMSLKDITNLKKPPATPSSQEPTAIPTITSNLSSLRPQSPIVEPEYEPEPEPINLVYDTCEIANIEPEAEDSKNDSFNMFTSESTIYGEDNNANNVSIDRVSFGSNYSDELADMTPTQVSQALADTLQISEDEKRYLHSFQTVCHVRTLMEPLYPHDIGKEDYKRVAKTVTTQFMGEMSDKDLVKPLVLSPTRKTKIQQLLDQELMKTLVIGKSLFQNV